MSDRAEKVARKLWNEIWDLFGSRASVVQDAAIERIIAAALRAFAEEVRREERDVAAKDAEMRYEDGYACGVVDERKACAAFLMRRAGIALEEEGAPWRGAGLEVAEVFRQAAAAIRARGEETITASPDLPSTDTRIPGLRPRATMMDDFEAGEIVREEEKG